MTYNEATFYFLTGTGNSYRAAYWMAEACQQHGIAAHVVPIQRAQPQEETRAGGDSLLGLISPTHGFTAPWLMLRFAMRLPRRRGAHALVVPTRAGSKLGRFYAPGLEGTAGYLLALILFLKGYNVRGVLGLDMPSNWIALHPGFSRPSAVAIAARAKDKAVRFVGNILSGRRCLSGFIPLLLGLVLAPISLGYLLVGRFYLAKLFFATERCTGCGLCAQACPAQAIRMWGKRAPRPYWTFSCESCMRCMNYCPEHAVEASHSLAVILYFVTTYPAWLVLLNWTGRQWPILAGLNNTWTQMFLEYLYILGSIGLTYLVFALLIQIPVINRLFAVTTLTRYYRRYHEPETALKDIL